MARRRSLLKLTGLSIAALAAERFAEPLAFASSWKKVGSTEGGVRAWRKVTPQTGLQPQVVAIGCGGRNSFLLRSDGSVYSTGYNAYGGLGLGDTVDRSTWVQIAGVSGVKAIGAGGYGSSASSLHTSDGGLLVAGWNTTGEFASSTISGSRSQFVRVSEVVDVAILKENGQRLGVLRSDGTFWGSGLNSYGQLGDGTATDRSTLVPVIGVTAVRQFRLGLRSTFAITPVGDIFSAGRNQYGALGIGSATGSQQTFVQATGISQGIEIACGTTNTLILRADGRVFAVGRNNYGLLADGTTIDRSTFVEVLGISNVVSIAANEFGSYALRSDGFVFSAGVAHYLGDGTSTNRSTFAQVSNLSEIVTISCGYRHGFAVSGNGSVFAWGQNDFGQLGDSSTLFRSTFVQIF